MGGSVLIPERASPTMQHPTLGRACAVIAGASLLLTLGGVGGAVAAALVTSADIKDQTIRARDIADGGVASSEVRNESVLGADVAPGTLAGRQMRDGSVGLADLSTGVRTELAQRAQDGVAGLETDGARPGVTQLKDFPGNGENSTGIWAAGPAGRLQVAWVQCPQGKTALGGGYSRDAETTAALRGLQVITSAPAQIDTTKSDDPATPGDERVVSMGTTYAPIPDDAAKSFVPDGWVVEGFNNSNTDLIVRPWVTCAAVNN
jgi:hypothetical protein